MISIPWLSLSDYSFPPIETAMNEPNGLLAVGGDLSPDRLLAAYHRGIFPWFNPGDPILWWCPNPRTVIYPEQLHISRSLSKALRKEIYCVTFDNCFEDVMPLLKTILLLKRYDAQHLKKRNRFLQKHNIGFLQYEFASFMWIMMR